MFRRSGGRYGLGDEALKASWLAEVDAMRNRIISMRQTLVKELKAEMPDRNFDYLLQQRGMFSYTGLSEEQVERLRDEFGVYLIASGRMCVAGLNASNVHRVAGICRCHVIFRPDGDNIALRPDNSCCDHPLFRNKTADNPSF